MYFIIEGSIIMDNGQQWLVKVKNINDGFVYYIHSSLHKKWIDRMDSCGLLVGFCQIFEFLFWRHPFTTEDPLVSKWCNDTFFQMCFDEETNSYALWMAWGWTNVQQIFFFGELYL